MSRKALMTERIDDVLHIRMTPASGATASGEDDIVTALGDAIASVGRDKSVRVIVLTGSEDGEFLVTPPTSHYAERGHEDRITSRAPALNMTPRIVRTFRTMLDAPQPLIARVNGDAIGFGQSVMFACDFVVAWEDARVSDVHLGLGEVTPTKGGTVGPPFGVAPGDGAIALAPSFMAPAIAKEYFMLSTTHTARELAERHIINYAVPHDSLDKVVDRLTDEIRRRPAHLLAWTKHFLNLEMSSRVDTVLAAANAIEALDFQVQRRD